MSFASSSTSQRRKRVASELPRHSADHGGDAPKGGLLLDGTAKLNCDQTLKAMRAIQSGKMPPKVKLTGEEAGEVFHELLDLAEVKP